MIQIAFALILRIVSNPFANLFQKKLARVESSFGINFYSSLFMAALSLPLIFLIDFGAFGAEFYFFVLLSGFLCFMGTICLIKALSLGEMSVLGPINSYKSVVGLVFAFLFLGETPSLRALSGFLLIICASFLFLDEEGKFILNKSVALRFLALFFTGIEAVILKRIIILSSPYAALFFWVLSGLFFSFIFALVFGKQKLKSKKSLLPCFYIAFLLIIMQLSTNFVFKHLDVGLSLSLFQLSSVVSLFLGFKILGEKGVIKKSMGTFLMLLGSVLILL